MNKDLRRRLDRLERGRHQSVPIAILSDRWLQGGEGADLLNGWREVVRSGRGSVSGTCLVVIAPVLTDEEWFDQHARAFLHLH